jgi:hypothetical protein
MISTNGGITAKLVPLDASLFKCFDSMDDDDTGLDSLDDKGFFDSDTVSETDFPEKTPETVFDGTGYGSDTFEKPEAKRTKPAKKLAGKKTKISAPAILAEYTTPERRVDLLARPYEPSAFDKDPRPQWTPPIAANDNQQRKQTFPAFDEARNNTLMVGRDRADTLIQNEWAFDILLEIRDLMDAAVPKSAWSQYNGHGAADEHEPNEQSNSGFGMDLVHDHGPSVRKVKRLWEHGNDNEPSGNGKPWNTGTVDELKTVLSAPTNTNVKALSRVGALEFNEWNHVTQYHDKKGNWIKFKTKTRGAKGKRSQQVISDPGDTTRYTSAALPRNKRGSLTAGFFAGKTGSSNSVKPDTLDYEPAAGPTHSSNDPWVAEIAAQTARDNATVKLSQCRLLVGDQPYDALTQAASGFRIGELCGGRLGNTTDSAKGRNLLQFAIERIIEDRSRTFVRPKR